MCIDVLTANVSEGTSSSGTGSTDSHKLPGGCWELSQVLWKSSQLSQLLCYLSKPQDDILAGEEDQENAGRYGMRSVPKSSQNEREWTEVYKSVTTSVEESSINRKLTTWTSELVGQKPPVTGPGPPLLPEASPEPARGQRYLLLLLVLQSQCS